MPQQRDAVLDQRNANYKRLKALGKDMDEERRREKHTPRSLATLAKTLVNDQVPSLDRERLVADNPVLGTFDSANTTFQLSSAVIGGIQNIHVLYTDQTTGLTTDLKGSTANPPPPGSFFFDISNPKTIVVGNPPSPTDSLIAVYIAAR